MLADTDVLVVGAGQAGLAVSHELTRAGVDHVVVDRERAGAAWYVRWNSFRLVTPNHTIALPGGEYDGDDPAGYLTREQIIVHLRRYAASLPMLFIVSDVQLGPIARGADALSDAQLAEALETPQTRTWSIEAAAASGDKCPRCWRVVPELSVDPATAGVCLRCADALSPAGSATGGAAAR